MNDEHFMGIMSFNHLKSLWGTEVFNRWENWGLKRLSYLPKIKSLLDSLSLLCSPTNSEGWGAGAMSAFVSCGFFSEHWLFSRPCRIYSWQFEKKIFFLIQWMCLSWGLCSFPFSPGQYFYLNTIEVIKIIFSFLLLCLFY